MVEESCPAEEILPTPARPAPRMPSQSPALDISSRSACIGAVTGGEFATPLQDISNRSVGGVTVTGSEFSIAQDDIIPCFAACKSRRNFAARLVNSCLSQRRDLEVIVEVLVVRQASTA